MLTGYLKTSLYILEKNFRIRNFTFEIISKFFSDSFFSFFDILMLFLVASVCF